MALRLQRQVGLVPARELGVVRRAVFFALLTWLPPVAWAFYAGRALPGSVEEPLFLHFGVHVRFLLAVPALILGEAMAQRVSTRLIPYFLTSGVVPPAQRGAFVRVLGGVTRLRDRTREPSDLRGDAGGLAVAPGPGLRAAEAHRPPRSVDRADASRPGRRPGIREGHSEGLQPVRLRRLGGGGDQVDYTARLGTVRRSVRDRTAFDYIGNITRIDSDDTSNNHRVTLGWDRFLSKRLFINVVGLEWYRDPFQNIASRWTVTAGLGYEIVDNPRTSWSATAGPAWQATTWDSVPPGDDEPRPLGDGSFPEKDDTRIILGLGWSF